MALIVFLKGVNVGGHRRFRPTLLAEQMRHLDVVNVGSAGTFVVRAAVSRADLREEVARRLPFEAEIMVCEGREVVRLLSQDFFAGRAERADVVRFVSVLSRAPSSAPALPLQLPPDGQWLVKVVARRGRFVVGLHRRRMKVIGELGKLERIFGTPATTRTWRTMAAIGKVLKRPHPTTPKNSLKREEFH